MLKSLKLECRKNLTYTLIENSLTSFILGLKAIDDAKSNFSFFINILVFA